MNTCTLYCAWRRGRWTGGDPGRMRGGYEQRKNLGLKGLFFLCSKVPELDSSKLRVPVWTQEGETLPSTPATMTHHGETLKDQRGLSIACIVYSIYHEVLLLNLFHRLLEYSHLTVRWLHRHALKLGPIAVTGKYRRVQNSVRTKPTSTSEAQLHFQPQSCDGRPLKDETVKLHVQWVFLLALHTSKRK